MSLASNKTKNADILFYSRKSYDGAVNGSKFIDLWNEKPYYGKVDTNFNVIFPSPDSMKPINEQGSIFALNFVADAFNAFSAYIQQSSKNNGNFSKSNFFSPLQAHRGWESVNHLYTQQLNIINTSFNETYTKVMKGKNDRQVTSFDTFLPTFFNFLDITCPHFSITKSGTIIKSYCPHAISGLVIEIARGDYSNDIQKNIRYFSKTNFNFYLRLATTFGFYVDKAVPWRLVANLASPAWQVNPVLKEIVNSYFINELTPQSVFNGYYSRSYQYDVSALKTTVLRFYNTFVSSNSTFTVPEVCNPKNNQLGSATSSGKVRMRKVHRSSITLEDMESKYDDNFWLKLYFIVRLKELQIDASKRQVRHYMKNINQLYAASGFDYALAYIAGLFNNFIQKKLAKLSDFRKNKKNILTSGKTPSIIESMQGSLPLQGVPIEEMSAAWASYSARVSGVDPSNIITG